MIYTTYFSRLKDLPEHIIPVAICASVPPWYTGKVYKKLAPKWDTLNQFKRSGDEQAFTQTYICETLLNLSTHQVVTDITTMTGSEDVAFVCWERKGSFCHRNLVSLWLQADGYCVQEF